MDLLGLHFIRPAWLLALPLGVLLPLAWRRWRRPSGDWAGVCDPHLLRWLSVGGGAVRGGAAGAIAAGVALALSALALSGPSWQKLPDASFAASDAKVIALDLSASMLAEDLKPDRLTRARFRLSDLLQETREGQVGLVAYAGDAYVVAPLTDDTNTVANLLPALRPDVMPVAGSRADRALELAASLLERTGVAGGEILLITDEAAPRDAEAAARLAREGIVTSVLAVGTRDGAPVPSGGGFVTDGAGNVVIARLDPEALGAVAAAGGGRLSMLAAAGADRSPWRAAEGSRFDRRDDALGERWKDLGPWLVLLLLPLAAAAFRRGLLFGLVIVLAPLLPPGEAQAGLWDDLWQRRDQQAHEALQSERPEQAARLAKDPSLAGEALFRAGDYESAAQQWSGEGDANGHYNRGNALAHAGELEAAIGAYDRALELAPGMEDALYNRALVEELLRQQEQEQQSAQDQESEAQGEGDPQDGGGQPSDASDAQDSQQPPDGQPSGEPEEGEGSEGEQGQQGREQDLAQSWSEEDAQAMEQWLRRIPDDPGGLLRRKFRSQHQRRGAPPDEGDSW